MSVCILAQQRSLARHIDHAGAAWVGCSHYHGHALNTLVYGAKRWFLTPPPHARYDLKSGWEWYRQDYPALKSQVKIYECMQHEAEVLYVPHSWGHAVINTRTSVGFASEFKPLGELFAKLVPVTGAADGVRPEWSEKTILGRHFESLATKKSQFAPWDRREWADSPVLARDFL